MKTIYLIPVLILFAIPLLFVSINSTSNPNLPGSTGSPSPTTNSTPIATPTQTALPPSEPRVDAGCKVGGCSGTICQNVEEEDAITTCEWRDEYACYANASCVMQSDGNCGWEMNEVLKSCLANPPSELLQAPEPYL